jgi:hypothetical protein
MNGCTNQNNEKPNKEVDKELKHEEKRVTGEEGKKEAFLSNLGLARIF